MYNCRNPDNWPLIENIKSFVLAKSADDVRILGQILFSFCLFARANKPTVLGCPETNKSLPNRISSVGDFRLQTNLSFLFGLKWLSIACQTMAAITFSQNNFKRISLKSSASH